MLLHHSLTLPGSLNALLAWVNFWIPLGFNIVGEPQNFYTLHILVVVRVGWRLIYVPNMKPSTASVLQHCTLKVRRGERGGGWREAWQSRCALRCDVGGELLVSLSPPKNSLRRWQLKVKGETVIPVSCGGSRRHCVVPNWHLQRRKSCHEPRFDSVGVSLERSNLWPARCWPVTTALSAVNMLSAGLFNKGTVTLPAAAAAAAHSWEVF